MRVIAGVARGRKLIAPSGRHVRPTTDRVRESMFNALESLQMIRGAKMVDVFAGSGALGIEALSRRGESCLFIDADRKALAAVRANLDATDLAERASVLPERAESWVRRAALGSERFDLAFCDPPYDYEHWDELLVNLPARFAVLESDRVVTSDRWHVARKYRHGTTFVTLAQRVSDPVSGSA